MQVTLHQPQLFPLEPGQPVMMRFGFYGIIASSSFGSPRESGTLCL